MELYHLDWERSSAADGSRHLRLTLGFDEAGEAAGLYLQALEEGLYERVAEAEGDDLERLYAATNNGVMSSSWSRQPPEGVTPAEPGYHVGPDGTKYGLRSTSVGDLVFSEGRILAVDKIGFRDIGPDLRNGNAPAP